MKVRNVNGSDRWDAPSGYNSWLEYWEKNSGERAVYCSAHSCWGTNLVGAHVQKVDSNDQKYYIVPLCRSCNPRSGNFEVSSKLVPVPSNL